MQVEISWDNWNTFESSKWFNRQSFKDLINHYNQTLNATSSQRQGAFISSQLGILAFNGCTFCRGCCLFRRRLFSFRIINFFRSDASFLKRRVFKFLDDFNLRVDKFINHVCDRSEKLLHSSQKLAYFFLWIILKSCQVFLNRNRRLHHC